MNETGAITPTSQTVYEMNRETRAMEPKNSMSSNDRTRDERITDTIEALKQQVLKLKKKL